MLLFFLLKDKKNHCYQVIHHYIQKKKNLQEQGVQDVVNRNKTKFEPNGDLIDQAFSQCNENSINNQDPHSQTENGETPGAEYPRHRNKQNFCNC